MNDGPPKLPQPYYPQWSHSNEFAAYTADQMRAYAAQAVAAERERCAAAAERWGLARQPEYGGTALMNFASDLRAGRA